MGFVGFWAFGGCRVKGLRGLRVEGWGLEWLGGIRVQGLRVLEIWCQDEGQWLLHELVREGGENNVPLT